MVTHRGTVSDRVYCVKYSVVVPTYALNADFLAWWCFTRALYPMLISPPVFTHSQQEPIRCGPAAPTMAIQ